MRETEKLRGIEREKTAPEVSTQRREKEDRKIDRGGERRREREKSRLTALIAAEIVKAIIG